ncbi:ATP-binding protein [Salmonirosea aquatica]|uniref:ATP-dependent DNA helicase RecG n=1 Tax=Salmonirosea aquatica TaxID=2654236 RepID=A0A7C9BER4_9BACT|nr:ATP-dependent DNA helicase RecG [Cytophagaceae bacterium SJW1-29]
MSIDIKKISDEQRDRVLNLSEGHFYELKSKDIQPRKLTKTISAFSNSDGGDVYIGISEIKHNGIISHRVWDGFNTQESANGHIQIFTELFPFGNYFSYEFLETEDESSFVLHVSINKTNAICKASDGTPYVRKSAQNIPIKTLEDLKRLEYDKGITTFERQTINIPKTTIIDSEILQRFIKIVIPTTTPESWLKKQILIINDLPTVAGILLYSDEPQAALPKQSGVKVYRYKTRDEIGKRENLAFEPITVEGPMYDQIYETVNKVIKLVEDIKILTDKGLEKIIYPIEALHEIITNAILHRDYSINKDIHIRIFDNRIEIESPGRLPGHISPNNILSEQLARNGSLVRIINKFPNPPNKDIGEGLNTAFEALKKLKLKFPVITETDNSVLVKILHEPLASPEEIVMNYIQKHNEITNTKGRELTGIESENEMKRVFQRLQNRELIYLDPARKGPSSRWLLKGKPENSGNNNLDNKGQLSIF